MDRTRPSRERLICLCGSIKSVKMTVIDMHGHLGPWFYPEYSGGRKEVEALLVENGVDVCCVSSSKSLRYDTSEGNAELQRDIRDSKRLFGYVVVNPNWPLSIGDLELLKDRKFVGVKLHPDLHRYRVSSKKCVEAVERIAKATDVILCHSSGENSPPPECMDLAKQFKDVKFIFAHLFMGVPYASVARFLADRFESIEMVSGYNLDNVYLDTSHLSIFYGGCLEKIVEILGADRIVFGTDIPLLDQFSILNRVRRAKIRESDKSKILEGNAKKILRL